MLLGGCELDHRPPLNDQDLPARSVPSISLVWPGGCDLDNRSPLDDVDISGTFVRSIWLMLPGGC